MTPKAIMVFVGEAEADRILSGRQTAIVLDSSPKRISKRDGAAAFLVVRRPIDGRILARASFHIGYPKSLVMVGYDGEVIYFPENLKGEPGKTNGLSERTCMSSGEISSYLGRRYGTVIDVGEMKRYDTAKDLMGLQLSIATPRRHFEYVWSAKWEDLL